VVTTRSATPLRWRVAATRHLSGVALRVVTTSGSQNLAGSPVATARLATVITQLVVVAAILVLSVHAVRVSDAPTETAISAGGCVIAAVIGLSVVVSPQFLVWLAPFAALLVASRSRLDTAAALLIITAWVLTGIEFPHRYWSLALGLSPTTATLVAARTGALIAAAALLATRLVATARRPSVP